ncbi:MAG: zinc-ribbon domain-containing protein [Paracoccaceae bacterium]
MRLICPNCDAQYEVDDAAIPEAGRDVQCSNCGHAWFQLPMGEEEEAELLPDSTGQIPVPQVEDYDEDYDVDLEAEFDDAAEADAPEAQAAADEPAEPVEDAAEETEADDAGTVTDEIVDIGDADTDGDDADTADEADEDAGDETPPPAVAPGTGRRQLDDHLLNILREEAEREAAQRQAESPLETQTEMGLASAVPAAAAATGKPRLDPILYGEDAGEADDDGGARAGFPDVDEINSSLRAADERGAEDEPIDEDEARAEERRRGFRLGFRVIVLTALIFFALYLFAPLIAERFPQTAKFMNAYLVTVDLLRLKLDEWLRAAIAAIQQMTNGGAS